MPEDGQIERAMNSVDASAPGATVWFDLLRSLSGTDSEIISTAPQASRTRASSAWERTRSATTSRSRRRASIDGQGMLKHPDLQRRARLPELRGPRDRVRTLGQIRDRRGAGDVLGARGGRGASCRRPRASPFWGASALRAGGAPRSPLESTARAHRAARAPVPGSLPRAGHSRCGGAIKTKGRVARPLPDDSVKAHHAWDRRPTWLSGGQRGESGTSSQCRVV